MVAESERAFILDLFRRCCPNVFALGKKELYKVLNALDADTYTEDAVQKLVLAAGCQHGECIDVEAFLNWLLAADGQPKATSPAESADRLDAATSTRDKATLPKKSEKSASPSASATEDKLADKKENTREPVTWTPEKVYETSPAAPSPTSGTVDLSVHAMSGEVIAKLNVALTDTIAEVKRCLAQAGGPPAPLQRLIIAGVVAQDSKSLADCGVVGPKADAQLVRMPPPPLLVKHLQDLLDKPGDLDDLHQALSNLFDGRDIDAPVREGNPYSDAESDADREGDEAEAEPEDDEDPANEECGPALWMLSQLSASPDAEWRRTEMASWLLSKGAKVDASYQGHSILRECLRQCRVPLARLLLKAGATPPSLMDLIAVAPRDYKFYTEGWRRHEPANIDGEAGRLRSMIAFMREELFPRVGPVPTDLLRQKISPDSPDQETQETFLQIAAGSGLCWLLAELVRRGAAWEEQDLVDPDDGQILPRGGLLPPVTDLMACADTYEWFLDAVETGAQIRAALCRKDAGEVRRLLATPHGNPNWDLMNWDSQSESLLLTAVKSGGDTALFKTLLDDARFDPNVGVYEYGWHGSFQLYSLLGYLAEVSVESSYDKIPVRVEPFEDLVRRLAAHPGTDLSFGRISMPERRWYGHQRSKCDMETPLLTFGGNRQWRCVLHLLQAGAPLPRGRRRPWEPGPGRDAEDFPRDHGDALDPDLMWASEDLDAPDPAEWLERLLASARSDQAELLEPLSRVEEELALQRMLLGDDAADEEEEEQEEEEVEQVEGSAGEPEANAEDQEQQETTQEAGAEDMENEEENEEEVEDEEEEDGTIAVITRKVAGLEARQRQLKAQLAGALALSTWLERVSPFSPFSFGVLDLYPTPFRCAVAVLRRGLPLLPPLAWEWIFGYLPFHAFPAVRPSYGRSVRLAGWDVPQTGSGGRPVGPEEERCGVFSRAMEKWSQPAEEATGDDDEE